MIKLVYGLVMPVDIFNAFATGAREELLEGTINDKTFSFNYAFSEGCFDNDLETAPVDQVVFGVDFWETPNNFIRLEHDFVNSLNKEDAVIAEHPIFTEKMQSVLKCWMYAFGNITRSADEFWNELTQEERYERIAHLALPESINLEWHIFSVED